MFGDVVSESTAASWGARGPRTRTIGFPNRCPTKYVRICRKTTGKSTCLILIFPAKIVRFGVNKSRVFRQLIPTLLEIVSWKSSNSDTSTAGPISQHLSRPPLVYVTSHLAGMERLEVVKHFFEKLV